MYQRRFPRHPQMEHMNGLILICVAMCSLSFVNVGALEQSTGMTRLVRLSRALTNARNVDTGISSDASRTNHADDGNGRFHSRCHCYEWIPVDC